LSYAPLDTYEALCRIPCLHTLTSG